MRFKSKASASVEAVQWKGDNLTEIQTFMYPSSPLFNADQLRDSPGSTMKPALGLHVFTAEKYSPFQLQHPAIGSWIVKGPIGFKILSAEEFEELYEPAVARPNACSLDHTAMRNEARAKHVDAMCPECDEFLNVVAVSDVRRPNDPLDVHEPDTSQPIGKQS